MKLKEHCENNILVTEKDIDFDFYTLKQAGVWCVYIETETYKFYFYSNDMDPHLWFGSANRKPGDGYNHAFYPDGRSHYSTLYDAEDCTPLEIIEKYYEGKTANITAIITNKPTLSLKDAITFGTCAIVKKDPLQEIGFKSEADRMLSRSILDAANVVVKEYNLEIKTEGYGRTTYPDTYDLPNQGKEIVARGVELAVANFKAAKKAKAAEKKAIGLNESEKTEKVGPYKAATLADVKAFAEESSEVWAGDDSWKESIIQWLLDCEDGGIWAIVTSDNISEDEDIRLMNAFMDSPYYDGE